MPYKIELNDEKDFIDMVYTGTVTPDEVYRADSEAYKLANIDEPTLFLTDLLHAELAFTIIDLYNKPNDWAANKMSFANKLAIVAKKDGRGLEISPFWCYFPL